jgi:glycosyltransferase involved in cell wall biosynthesis
MNEQHPYRATILAVPEGTPRPLWSVMIPTYNCANYLRETLASVLAQDPGPEVMQIEVVDDHSTKDDPEAVVREFGRGRVNFYRQPQNVGYIKNFETCLQRSRGKLIHLLHGDDLALSGFYRKMQLAFEKNQQIGAAFCRHIFADDNSHWQSISKLEQGESGILNNWLEKIIVYHPIQTPSIVVRRDVYEQVSGFDTRFLGSCEDWEMWIRIATRYPIWYEVEPLAVYRMHSTSLTGNAVRSAENTRDAQRAIEIVQSYIYQYLPKATADDFLNNARKNSANYAIYLARKLYTQGDIDAGQAQIREALKFGYFLRVIRQVIDLNLWWNLRQFKKLVKYIFLYIKFIPSH